MKLQQGLFRLDIRKSFFTEEVVGHWNWLPIVVATALNLSAFKKHIKNILLDILSDFLGGPLGTQVLDLIFVNPSQLGIFYDSHTFNVLRESARKSTQMYTFLTVMAFMQNRNSNPTAKDRWEMAVNLYQTHILQTEG